MMLSTGGGSNFSFDEDKDKSQVLFSVSLDLMTGPVSFLGIKLLYTQMPVYCITYE